MAGTIEFLLWQAALLSAATRVALWLGRRAGARQTAEEFLALVLGADILLESASAEALSFAGVNGVGAYATVGGVLLAFGARPAVVEALASGCRGLVLWRTPVTAAVACAAAVPVLLLVLKPIDEIDSMNYLHYMLEWAANRVTPFTFATSYVAFWESSFVPALVLARADWFFGVIAIKPVLLMGLALCLVGETLELRPRILVPTVAAAMALQHLWGNHSGAGTLKVDALHAAGVVLMAAALLRTARRGWGPGEPALVALGAAFASVRYTGPPVVALAAGALLVLRAPLRQLAPAALLVMATSGPYYARSLWRHGNPVYPFTVPLGLVTLPGTADLTATSIAANLGDPRLWAILLWPAHGLSPAGLLFPVALPAMLGAALWVSVRGVRRRPLSFWLGTLVLAGWLIFVRTFLSAGPGPRDLEFIASDLSTLRYVEGFLVLGELFLVWRLARRGIPESVLLGLVAIHGASRLWLLGAQPNLWLFPPAGWVAAAVAAGWLSARFPALAPAVLAVAVIGAAPTVVEWNRQLWLPSWKEVYEPVRTLPPSRIFLLEDPRSGYNAIRFALAGPGLRHDVRSSTDAGAVGPARYAVRVLGDDLPPSELAAFAARLQPEGFRPVLEASRGIVLERMAVAPWMGEAAVAWHLAPGNLPVAGGEVDEGGSAASAHRLRAGELVFARPGRLLRVDEAATVAIEPREGAEIRLLNGGPLRDGHALGLVYRFQAGRWEPGQLAPVPAGSPWVSIERGQYRREPLEDAGGPFVRIHALNDAAWLVLAAAVPARPNRAPYTASGIARCPPGATCRFRLATRGEPRDWTGLGTGKWETFRDLRRVSRPASGDYVAVGRQPVRAGDFFDVRELGVRDGFFP